MRIKNLYEVPKLSLRVLIFQTNVLQIIKYLYGLSLVFNKFYYCVSFSRRKLRFR